MSMADLRSLEAPGPLSSDFGKVDMAEEQRLFDELRATKRQADRTEDPADYRNAAKAYVAYLRFHLTEPERECLRLEDEIVRLTTENRLLKMRSRFDA